MELALTMDEQPPHKGEVQEARAESGSMMKRQKWGRVIVKNWFDGRMTRPCNHCGCPVAFAAAKGVSRSCEHTLKIHFARTLLAAARVGVRSCEDPMS